MKTHTSTNKSPNQSKLGSPNNQSKPSSIYLQNFNQQPECTGRSRSISQKIDNNGHIQSQQVNKAISKSTKKIINKNPNSQSQKKLLDLNPKSLKLILKENQLLKDEISQLRSLIQHAIPQIIKITEEASQEEDDYQGKNGSNSVNEQNLSFSQKITNFKDVQYMDDYNLLRQSLKNTKESNTDLSLGGDSEFMEAEDIETNTFDERQSVLNVNRFIQKRASTQTFGLPPNQSCNVSCQQEQVVQISRQVYATSKIEKIKDLNKASKNFNMPLTFELKNQLKEKLKLQKNQINQSSSPNLRVEVLQQEINKPNQQIGSPEMSIVSKRNFNSRNGLNSYVSNTSNNFSNASCISDDDNGVPIDTLKKSSLLNQNKLPKMTSPQQEYKKSKAMTYKNNCNKILSTNLNINKLEMVHPKSISKDDSCYNIETIISMNSSQHSDEDIQQSLDLNQSNVIINDETPRARNSKLNEDPSQLLQEARFAHQIKEVNFDNQKDEFSDDKIVDFYFDQQAQPNEVIFFSQTDQFSQSKRGSLDPFFTMFLNNEKSPQKKENFKETTNNFENTAQLGGTQLINHVTSQSQKSDISMVSSVLSSTKKNQRNKENEGDTPSIASPKDVENYTFALKSLGQAKGEQLMTLDESLPQLQFLAIQQSEKPFLEISKSLAEDGLRMTMQSITISRKDSPVNIKEAKLGIEKQIAGDFMEKNEKHQRLQNGVYTKWTSKEDKEKNLVTLNMQTLQRTQQLNPVITRNILKLGNTNKVSFQQTQKVSFKDMVQETNNDQSSTVFQASDYQSSKLFENKLSFFFKEEILHNEQNNDGLCESKQCEEQNSSIIRVEPSPLITLNNSNVIVANQSQTRYSQLAESVKKIRHRQEYNDNQLQEVHNEISQKFNDSYIITNQTPRALGNEQITVLDIQQPHPDCSSYTPCLTEQSFNRLQTIEECQPSIENYRSVDDKESEMNKKITNFFKNEDKLSTYESVTRISPQQKLRNDNYVQSSLTKLTQSEEFTLVNNPTSTRSKAKAEVKEEMFNGETLVLDININPIILQKYGNNCIIEQPSIEDLEESSRQMYQHVSGNGTARLSCSSNSRAAKDQIKQESTKISLAHIDMQDSEMFSNDNCIVVEDKKLSHSKLRQPQYFSNSSKYRTPIKSPQQSISLGNNKTPNQNDQSHSRTIDQSSQNQDKYQSQKHSIIQQNNTNEKKYNSIICQSQDKTPTRSRQNIKTPSKQQSIDRKCIMSHEKSEKERKLIDKLTQLQDRLDKKLDSISKRQSTDVITSDIVKSQTIDNTQQQQNRVQTRARIMSLNNISREQLLQQPSNHIIKKTQQFESRQQELEEKLKEKEQRIKIILQKKKLFEESINLKRIMKESNLTLNSNRHSDFSQGSTIITSTNQQTLSLSSRTPIKNSKSTQNKTAAIGGGIQVYQTQSSTSNNFNIPQKDSLRSNQNNQSDDKQFRIVLQSMSSQKSNQNLMAPQSERNHPTNTFSPALQGLQYTQKQLEFFKRLEGEQTSRRYIKNPQKKLQLNTISNDQM